MPACVRIVSVDAAFAGSVGRRLEAWGLSVAVESDMNLITPSLVRVENIDVVLLDVRGYGDRVVTWLSALRETAPGVEVVLLNASGDVKLSIEAMRAGAASELPAPLDMEKLRGAIADALRRRNKRPPRRRPSLLDRFERAMSAATFAQAGEFDAARDLLGEGGPAHGRRGGKGRNRGP